jgi:hypothetical protein
MNVNGLAGGLELYFGTDVLRKTDGSLTPVEWGGFIAAVGRYQGALQEKTRLQEVYNRKLDELSRGKRLTTHDWSGMEIILNSLCDSFSKMKE